MKNIIAGAAFAAIMGAVSASPSHANVVVNGSFEDTTGRVADGRDTMIQSSGSTAINGWTVAGPSTAVGWIGPGNSYGLAAPSGNYFLDLTGDYDQPGSNGTVKQTIATSVAGYYTLTFLLGSKSEYVSPAGVHVTAGNTTQDFLTTDINNTAGGLWETKTLTFASTGDFTDIVFSANVGKLFVGLDNVDVELTTVSAVPEPSTWAMMILGFAGIGTMAYRRRKGSVAA